MGTPELERLLTRAEGLLARLESVLPPAAPAPDWSAPAHRWRGRGGLEPIHRPHRIDLSRLHGIEPQKAAMERNTRQFVAGYPANNVLLTGARGTGKSSLVKAVFQKFRRQGLRLIEVDKTHLLDLPDIVALLEGRPERFILFCDDLSFESGEPGYKALKATLDGSLTAPPENVLIYATSNRRHLLPEYLEENLGARHVGTEVHEQEAVEEKISLSERFGLWLSFYPFDQDAYLAIAARWAEALGAAPTDPAAFQREALQWALSRGSRSGRTAWQFARDWAGRQCMKPSRKGAAR